MVAAASARGAAPPNADYDLHIHDGAVSTVFRLRDSGIRLVGDRVEWTIGGDRRHAALADIVAIRLTAEVETARGPMGSTSCQLSFHDGSAVTIFGGNSHSPDPVARRARYDAFIADLHRRLGQKERARIRFIAGFGGARFGILLAAMVVSTLFLVLATVALLSGVEHRHLRAGFALAFGSVMTVGLFRLLQLNAPHVYDPADPLGSAAAGSIGDTFRTTIGEIRRGMTRRRLLAVGAIGAAIAALAVLVVAAHQRVDLTKRGEARLAFAAVFARMPMTATVIYVTVTPDELLVQGAPGADSASRTEWRASRRTLFGWSEWDDVAGPTQRYPLSMADEPGEEPFKLEREDTARLDDLVTAAVERAALGSGARVTRMTLIAPYVFTKTEPPRWTVEVSDGGSRTAKVVADRRGRLYPATPAPAGPPRIVIRIGPGSPYGFFPASAGTWIRITNPDGSVRFDGTLKVGESYSVPDVTGLVLRTGKPDTLEMSVDGRQVEPPRAGYAGRLEMVLDPEALRGGSAVAQ